MGKAKDWVEAKFPSYTGYLKAALILAYGAGLDAGLAEAQELIQSGLDQSSGARIPPDRTPSTPQGIPYNDSVTIWSATGEALPQE